MTAHRTDPLLLAGKVLTLIIQAAMAIGAVALAIALPATLLARAGYFTGMLKTDGVPTSELPMASLSVLLLIALCIVAAYFVFFGKLRAIIATVGERDPFSPENARRLSEMAWLLLATQLLALPALALATQVIEALGKLEELRFSIADDGLDITGILMVLILFILARVFRQGALMREDLEGTV